MLKFDRTAGKRSFCLFAALALPLIASGQSPKLIPTPREFHADSLFPIATATVTVAGSDANANDANAEDLFTARDLTHALVADGIHTASPTGTPDLTVTL